MFTLVTQIQSPFPELLFSAAACLLMLLAVLMGASRVGACIIGYSLAVMLHLDVTSEDTLGHRHWIQFTDLFDELHWHFYAAQNMATLITYVILPWLVLLFAQWMIPRHARTSSDDEPRIYCTVCAKCLTDVSSLTCPECGGAFDPQDPNTTSRDKTQFARTLKLFNRYKKLHQIILALIAVVFAMIAIAIMIRVLNPFQIFTVVILPLILLLSLLLLWFQTQLALKVFGKRYALGYLLLTLAYLFLTLAFSVTSVVGIVLVPLLIMKDVKHQWKTKPQFSPPAVIHD